MLTEKSSRQVYLKFFLLKKIFPNRILFALQSRSFNKHHDISFTNIVIIEVSIISVEIIRKGCDGGDCNCIEFPIIQAVRRLFIHIFLATNNHISKMKRFSHKKLVKFLSSIYNNNNIDKVGRPIIFFFSLTIVLWSHNWQEAFRIGHFYEQCRTSNRRQS